MTPTALEIIKKYLVDRNYAGLCNPDLECGCEVDNLAPCCSDFSDCKPGYKAPAGVDKFIIVEREELLRRMGKIK